MEEIFIVITYHEEKRSAKITSGNYCCEPKRIKSTQCKAENNIKSNTGIVCFFHFPESPNMRKQWLQAVSGYLRKMHQFVNFI